MPVCDDCFCMQLMLYPVASGKIPGDLFDQNISAEGYKAVNNFLSISGLNAGFFKQENDRILKQRIENLNGEITIDFHEFWSQKIGKQNKLN